MSLPGNVVVVDQFGNPLKASLISKNSLNTYVVHVERVEVEVIKEIEIEVSPVYEASKLKKMSKVAIIKMLTE